VAEKGYNLNNKIGRDSVSWAIHTNGKAYHDNVGSAYCAPLKARNAVTVTINREEGALYYSVDGYDYGRAFTNPKL
jgi:hypothetical protein